MPKLRNAPTDLAKLVQWLGRKCRNHHPLEELSRSNRTNLPRTYKARSSATVTAVGRGGTTVLYQTDGRVFAINAIELTDRPDEVARLRAEGETAIGF